MILRPKLTRIPGELVKTRPDKYTQDITKLTKPQLLEIKEREEKLLAKKAQLARLPDKGAKIIKFYEKVLQEIAQRDEVEQAAKLFSDLNIAEKATEKLNNLEWTGQLESQPIKEIILDSDDEETDPLKIVAQSTDLRKHVKYVTPEAPLITEKDLKEIEEMKNDKLIIDSELVDIQVTKEILKEKLIDSKLNNSLSSSQNDSFSSNSSLNLEPHVLYLIDKGIDGLPEKERFLPHKTTKSNIHDPQKGRNRKVLGKYWEVTAATPPPIQHNGAVLISLKDSVEIQAEYLEKLKKLQEEQAAKKLADRQSRKDPYNILLPDEQIRKVNKFFGSYREHELSSDESEEENLQKEKFIDSDEGVHDDEDDKGGCVNYTICE